jgi:hypothetical protein
MRAKLNPIDNRQGGTPDQLRLFVTIEAESPEEGMELGILSMDLASAGTWCEHNKHEATLTVRASLDKTF